VREELRLRAAVWMLISAIIVRELAPFRFSSTPGSFSWMPFQTAIENERQGAAISLLREAFDYGGLVWLLSAARASYGRAGLVTVALAAVLGAMQMYVPLRHASITGPVTACLLAVGMAMTGTRPQSAGDSARSAGGPQLASRRESPERGE